MVGANEFVESDEELDIPILKIDHRIERERSAEMDELRRSRDNERAERSLRELADAARGDDNLMPYLLECARAYDSVGEANEALQGVFGTYREPAVF